MTKYCWEKELFFWCIYPDTDRGICIAMVAININHAIYIWNGIDYIAQETEYDDIDEAKAVAMALVAMTRKENDM